MEKLLPLRSTGGKGNLGLFIERDPKIFAAGKPSDKPEETVKKQLEYYSLQDEVDTLIGDAIIPSIMVTKSPSKIYRAERDMRHASIFSEGSELINPPIKTKFESLVEDLKNTAYNSYWKKEVGKVPDPTPTLPEGFDIVNTRFGIKTINRDSLYEIIMPKNIKPDIKDERKDLKINRKYCSFNPNATFGRKTNSDPSGKYIRCCLENENIYLGTALKSPILDRKADFRVAKISRLGKSLEPNNNIKCVPEGFAFGKIEPPASGNISECLKNCKINSHKEFIKKCLAHLNTLRKCLSKRHDGSFFPNFYLLLKYLDRNHVGYLPKEIVYKECTTKYIRLNPAFIEPLLSIWDAFDGSQIDYKKFCNIINFKEPTPDLPKIEDIPKDCIDFRTTYGEMVRDVENKKQDQQLMAGIPSGRYLDQDYPITPEGCCMAHRSYLPEESDAKACLSPSIFTLLGISHRDMYAKRDPATIKSIFKKAGETFDDVSFATIWDMAKKAHPKEWVCYETFRRALYDYNRQVITKV